jgi:hypothetical protein
MLNLMVDDKTKIICGFPGVGKSYLFSNEFKDLKIQDSDSSTFDKKDFPKNYIDHIKSQIGHLDVHLVSTHNDVIAGLINEGLSFSIVYPDISLKDEYLKRYVDRGSPEGFVKLLDEQWDNFIGDIESIQNLNVILIKLSKGQYLKDVLKDIL